MNKVEADKIIKDIEEYEMDLEITYGEIIKNENSPYSISECLKNPDMEIIRKYNVTPNRSVLYFYHIPTQIIYRLIQEI